MEIMHTDKAPAAVGPYSQAVKTGNLLFCSGQIGLNPATGEMVGTTVAEQAKQVMENVKALLENAVPAYRLFSQRALFARLRLLLSFNYFLVFLKKAPPSFDGDAFLFLNY